MIEPALRDEALAEDIVRAGPASGKVACWWLGQSGFVLKGGGKVAVIDPYLSDSLQAKYAGTRKPHERMMPRPIRPELLSCVDLVLATHKHTDHMDPQTLTPLLRASPGAMLVLPRAHVALVLSWGIERSRLLPIDADEEASLPGMHVRAVPAAHERVERNERGEHLFLGYVLRIGDVSIYHSGDTIPYPGQVERLRPRHVNVAMLPVNGRDARRVALGTPGNCSIDEALCLAALIEADVLVPCHYDLFAFNTVDVRVFEARRAEAWPDLRTTVMTPGKRYDLP